MQRIESCVVTARKRNKYYVKIFKRSECGGCRACGFGRKNFVVMRALSNIECSVGDSVNVQMPQKTVKASYIYLYLLPLLFAFIGIMCMYGYGEKFMMLGGAIGLAASFFVIYLIEKLIVRKKEYLPIIISKIPDKGENND